MARVLFKNKITGKVWFRDYKTARSAVRAIQGITKTSPNFRNKGVNGLENLSRKQAAKWVKSRNR